LSSRTHTLTQRERVKKEGPLRSGPEKEETSARAAYVFFFFAFFFFGIRLFSSLGRASSRIL